MAFDPTISAQLDKALRKLTEIEHRIGGAQIRAAKNASTTAVNLLHNIKYDSGTQQLIKNMLSYRGVRSADAPRRFLAEFSRAINNTVRDMQSVAGMMREMENRAERIAARQAGVSEKEFFMARKIEKIKANASTQMSLNNELIAEAALQKRRLSARARTSERAMERDRANILTNSRTEISGLRSQLRSGSRPMTADELAALQNQRTDLSTIASRDKKGKTRAERAAIDARLLTETARIDAQITANQKNFTLAEMKALRMRMQTLQAEAASQRKLLKERIDASRAATLSEKSAIDAQIRALQDANAEIDVSTRDLENLLGQHRMANAEEFLLDLKDKVPGMGLVNSWQKSGSAIATTLLSSGKLIGKLIGIGFLGLFMFAVKALFNNTIATLKAFRDAGYTGTQAKSQIGAARWDQYELAKTGVMASAEQIAEGRAGLATELGTLALPEKLTRDAQMLVAHFKMGGTAAGALTGAIYRIAKGSDLAASNVLQMTLDLANGSGVSTTRLLESMTENMEELARGGTRTAQAFIEANAQAIRMGVSLSKVMDIANKFSTDFEGFLEAQASLNVFAPGMDLTALGNASVFGSEQDVLSALKEAVGGLTGYQDMTRSQQNLIARSIGLSVGDITNMLNDPQGRTLQQKSYDLQQKMATSAIDALTGENSIPALLQQIISIITSGIGGILFGKSGPTDPTAVSGRGVPIPAVKKHSGGYIDATTAPRYHSGLLPNEVPAILMRGEAVLTGQMLAGLTKLMTSVSSLGRIGELANSKLANFKPEALTKNISGLFSTAKNGLLGKVSTMFGGKVGSIASKVPGIGGAISGLLGGGTKGLGSSLFSMGATKLLGGLVGGPMGVAAMSLIQKIPGVSNVIGGVGKLLGKTGLGSAAKIGKKVFGKLGGLFGKKKKASSIVPQISQLGSFFGGPSIMGADTELDPMAMLFNQRVGSPVGSQAQGGTTVVSMKTIETLLQELISATKEGKVIQMDGRKVGETITSAFSRG